jgi:hypothetical protein
VKKLICEGTPDLVQEFLAFVPPAPGARLNFGKDLLARRFHPVNLRSTCVVRAAGLQITGEL